MRGRMSIGRTEKQYDNYEDLGENDKETMKKWIEKRKKVLEEE